MKSVIFIILLLLTSCSTTLKGNKSNLTNRKIEKLNIEEFSNHKNLRINEKITEIKNDTIIELAELEDKFIKYTRAVDGHLENRKVYSKENYGLIAEVNYFYKFPVGISHKYDWHGNIIEEKNQDKNYSFSVDQFIVKIKNQFGIDLTQAAVDNIGIDRRYEGGQYIYVMIISNQKGINKVREIKISGMDGSIISDEMVGLEK